jgi:hypothetical protein
VIASRCRLSGRASIVLVSLFGAGCGPDDREIAYYEPEPAPPPREVARATVDADGFVTTESPGERVAVMVEYERGGGWFVGVTCDTATSGYACDWDIIVRTLDGEPLFRILETELERSDYLLVDLAAARLVSYTTEDLDGFSFRVGEASGLTLDVFLDGRARPEFLEWVGDGALHQGAPTNPFELVPDEP